MSSFKLERCEHTQRRMTPLAIVKDLEIFEDRARQFDGCHPALSIQEFHVHAAPERFDHGVVAPMSSGCARGRPESGDDDRENLTRDIAFEHPEDLLSVVTAGLSAKGVVAGSLVMRQANVSDRP